jgi:hypothetical protein
MRAVILQPGYLPWLGFFEQMYNADAFVFYDDVQYTGRDWRSRNRIKTPNGASWLTVPVAVAGRSSLIKDAKIADKKWAKQHLTSLRLNYGRAPYYSLVFPLLEEVMREDWLFLSDLDITLIRRINAMLNLDRTIYLSSQLNIKGQRSERLLKICQAIGAQVYLSGAAATDYLDVGLFEKNEIKVEFQDYQHPVYEQLWGDFIPYLSVVDLLFNHGPDSLAIITRRKIIQNLYQ